MNQMFLTIRGAVQGFLMARLCLASVFDMSSHSQDGGAWRCPPPLPAGFFFFSVNLDYLYFPVASSTSDN